MKALVVGFGSIGKRHFEILSHLENNMTVDIVTMQNVNINNSCTFKQLNSVPEISAYDYFVIASETSKHYQQLKYICSEISGKKIIVEKPLFDKRYEKFDCTNTVFTAYNLRFHPVIEQLRNIIMEEEVYYVNAMCGQYLPTWRPEQDYRQSYSSDLKQGGGVLRDLSHELDYLIMLFGDIDKIKSIDTKISDLEINSDDIFTAIAVTKSKVIINVTVDYISKAPIRRLVLHTQNNTIEVDVIKNNIVIHNKDSSVKMIEVDKKDRNYSYKRMHESILNDEYENACSYDEGNKIVELIDSIKFKEL